ncbi:MAG: formylglycine-generating enzyme family protein [Magnetococcales bacterium]|nr:formylglycine-generating enzyme family protein [Magnetococcales bacterium]
MVHNRPIWTDPLTQMNFVWIPKGRFVMGSPSGEEGHQCHEAPLHEVQLSGFWLGQSPVTQGEWQRIMSHNPAGFRRGAHHPVEKVSWHDAQCYIDRLNQQGHHRFRLPTEAEWEYACRSGTTTPFCFGATIRSDTQANYNGNYPYNRGSKRLYRQATTPVGSFPGNDFGLYDMHGNVWEWCQDWYDAEFYRHTDVHQDPVCLGDASGSRVIRGGSWDDSARRVRSAERYHDRPDSRSDYVGFRLVCSMEGT